MLRGLAAMDFEMVSDGDAWEQIGADAAQVRSHLSVDAVALQHLTDSLAWLSSPQWPLPNLYNRLGIQR
jgi:hypothetical protein